MCTYVPPITKLCLLQLYAPSMCIFLCIQLFSVCLHTSPHHAYYFSVFYILHLFLFIFKYSN